MTAETRLVSQLNTNPYAKAGLMIRTSDDPWAAHVILDAKPDGGIEFMTRANSGENTMFVAGAGQPLPVWLRLIYDGQMVVGQVSADGMTWSTVGSVPFTGALYIGFAVTSHDNNVLNQAVFDNTRVVAEQTGGFLLPSPWAQRDIATTGLSGSASYANGTFTVRGAGADIWGTSDSFRFVYDTRVSGVDTHEISVRVTGIESTNPYAKAGIMIRNTLDPNSSHVVLNVKPDGGVEFMSRLSSGSETTFLAGGSLSTPGWLRLVLNGDVASGYISSDGVTWSKIGEIAIIFSSPNQFSPNYYIGLAVTSHDTSAINTATFDNVIVGWSSQDIGIVGTEGRVAVENERFMISAAGSDIWGATDSFHYVYRPLTFASSGSSHSISARVSSLQNTNPYAKAGVMIRDSLDPDAAQVILDVKPDGGIEFMVRSVTGGSTTFVAGGTYRLLSDSYLRLAMDGQTFSAYLCDVENRCQLLGTTTASISTNGYLGVAVTSHDPNVLTTAVFDRLRAN